MEKLRSTPMTRSLVALASSKVPRPTEQPMSSQMPCGGAARRPLAALKTLR